MCRGGPSRGDKNLPSKWNYFVSVYFLLGPFVLDPDLSLNGWKGLGVAKLRCVFHRDLAKSKHAVLVFVCRITLLPNV